MLEAFVSKSILHVYQNVRFYFLKKRPFDTNCTFKKAKVALPSSVLSPK
jgi:hypothetical protein